MSRTMTDKPSARGVWLNNPCEQTKIDEKHRIDNEKKSM